MDTPQSHDQPQAPSQNVVVFTPEEVRNLIAALGEVPYKQSASMIRYLEGKLQQTWIAQMTAPPAQEQDMSKPRLPTPAMNGVATS